MTLLSYISGESSKCLWIKGTEQLGVYLEQENMDARREEKIRTR